MNVKIVLINRKIKHVHEILVTNYKRYECVSMLSIYYFIIFVFWT